jgi:hypothetical protein
LNERFLKIQREESNYQIYFDILVIKN